MNPDRDPRMKIPDNQTTRSPNTHTGLSTHPTALLFPLSPTTNYTHCSVVKCITCHT